MYEGATAIGKFAWTPGAAFEPVATKDNPLLVDEEDCKDNSGLPHFQPSAQHEHTVHHTCAQEEDTPVTVHAASSAIHADDTPTSGWSKRKFSRTTHPQRKKGKVREHRSWRVAWKTLCLQLNYNNEKYACIMSMEIQPRTAFASVWHGCTPYKAWTRKTH